MKLLFAALLALLPLATQARPLVIEDRATLVRPDSSWQYFGRFGVAIDGDFALVSGERFAEDASVPGGVRREAAAFVYRRSGDGSRWNYVSQLGPVATLSNNLNPGLAMKGGVAITVTDRWRLWENVGGTFTPATINGLGPTELQGTDIEIDSGRILAGRVSCNFESVVLAKLNGAWGIEGRLVGRPNYCVPTPRALSQDIQGDRAITWTPPDPYPDVGKLSWHRFIEGAWQEEYLSYEWRDPQPLAINLPYYAFVESLVTGTSIVYERPGIGGVYAQAGFEVPDAHLAPEPLAATTIERAGSYFVQRNYRPDRKGYVLHVFEVVGERAETNNHLAILQPRSGWFMGNQVDASANRIIVGGWSEKGGNNNVRVFELPASFDTLPVSVHDFEAPGATGAWQYTSGSVFSTAKVGYTQVLRQASAAGAASAYQSAQSVNQSIQAEVTPRAIGSSNAWVGLLTRRSDDQNYYYVTLRSSGTVELKRMVAGVFTTLASAPASLTLNRKYRLRLESTGTLHSVYVDDRLALTVRDRTLSSGSVGLMTNRTAADWDNVIITPNALATIYADDFNGAAAPGAGWSPSAFARSGGVFRHTYTADYARPRVGASTDDQIVQVRVRPTSFSVPEAWVGLLGRTRDDGNHLYVSWQGRGVISLWRRTEGVITQLATQRLAVIPGTWYTLRLEVVNDVTRVFVDDQLILASAAPPGPAYEYWAYDKGAVGIATYKAAAEYDDLVAYQP